MPSFHPAAAGADRISAPTACRVATQIAARWLLAVFVVVAPHGAPAKASPVAGAAGEATEERVDKKLRGRVLFAGEPLEAVAISVVGRAGQAAESGLATAGDRSLRAITDAQGEFELTLERVSAKLDPGLLVLLVERPGFEAVPITLASAQFDETDQRYLILLEAAQLIEVIQVVADQIGDRFSPHTLRASAVAIEDRVAPSNVTDLAIAIPGVAENGQGGLFQVLSIRGASRHRVMTLFDGARITTERRAGVSLSFIDPSLLSEIDIERGPASTYYGSGALGGAVHVYPQRFERLDLEAGWEQEGDQSHVSIGWGQQDLSLAVAGRRSSDRETADGDLRFDRFEQWSATLTGYRSLGSKELKLQLVPSIGSDIGKPNTDFPERTTLYPRERHAILNLQLSSGRDWRGRLYLHPNELETEVTGDQRVSSIDNEAVDFGLGFTHALTRSLSNRSEGFLSNVDGRIGVDYFGRRGVDAVERTSDSDQVLRSLDDGSVDEAAVFAVFGKGWDRLQLETGVRATSLRQKNRSLEPVPSASTSEEVVTGFVGFGLEVHPRLELLGRVGTGTRVPNLTELFFVGTTGRGRVVGNPLLEPEQSREGELGVRFTGGRSLVYLSAFRTEIDDYIERVDLDATGDLLGYRNLIEGTITGVELEATSRIGDRLKLDFGAHWIDGQGDDGAGLADIPVTSARLAPRFDLGPLSLAGSIEYRARKRASSLGPGEIAIPEAWLLEVAASRAFGPIEWTVYGSNLLDEAYLPSADRKSQQAIGRSLGLRLRLSM